MLDIESDKITEGFKTIPIIKYLNSDLDDNKNIQGYLAIEKHKQDFFINIEGDSMKDVGTHNGDYVLIQKQSLAENGDMILAQKPDGGLTCKLLMEASNKHVHSSYKRNYASNVILGKVVGLYRFSMSY